MEVGIEVVADELRAFQQAVDRYDEAVAAELGVNRTDLRALDVLEHRGPMTAGQLGEAVGLTSGSTTTMVDRLQQAGHVSRVRDERDRRRVLIQLTSSIERELAVLYGEKIARPGFVAASRFSAADLATVADFLRVSRGVYENALGAGR